VTQHDLLCIFSPPVDAMVFVWASQGLGNATPMGWKINCTEIVTTMYVQRNFSIAERPQIRGTFSVVNRD